MEIGDIIATLALFLAFYSTWKAIRFSKMEAQLNALLIERENDEKAEKSRAEISANFVKIGGGKLRLKIFNKGKATAKNVRVEVIDSGDLLAEGEVERKFPAPILEPQQYIEIIASQHSDSGIRVHLKVIWNDDAQNDNFKELYPTV